MHLFTDSAGRKWRVVIKLATVEKVRAELQVALPALFDDNCKAYFALLNDDSAFAAVVHACCLEPPAPLEDLKWSWDGAVADAAHDAFREELIDFFRDPTRRQAIRDYFETLATMGKKFQERIRQKLTTQTTPEKLDQAIDQDLDSLIASLSAAGSSAAPSASTPAPSASASSP